MSISAEKIQDLDDLLTVLTWSQIDALVHGVKWISSARVETGGNYPLVMETWAAHIEAEMARLEARREAAGMRIDYPNRMHGYNVQQAAANSVKWDAILRSVPIVSIKTKEIDGELFLQRATADGQVSWVKIEPEDSTNA